jgi:hypothetical protein
MEARGEGLSGGVDARREDLSGRCRHGCAQGGPFRTPRPAWAGTIAALLDASEVGRTTAVPRSGAGEY